ncbi:hypothetical protein THRCLA_05673 [Thraustotheca clavata]|uniref:RWP-RK domain-containing protein n=1 Tax=Thraustotheca clavata TaxID=74557 RepID=A0A1V9ZV60_9STRA|nr:hypothetical protein THRCLA_05673 [Thraustotheca clavata]
MQEIKSQTFEEAVLQTPLDAAASMISNCQNTEKSHLFTYLLPTAVPIPRNGWNVKDITLNELRPHFNKPMAAVAQEMGVCITLMKKICRKNGLTRWPHRRIRSLVNRITSLQAVAESIVDKPEKMRFHQHIASLRRELSDVIQNPNGKSRKAQEYERRKDEGSSASDDTDNSSELRTVIHAHDMDLSCFEVLEKVRGSIPSLLCD